MMIRRLHVQNFMSLKDTTIDLAPLAIFIGPNASGKSAIFKTLVTLSKLLRQFAVRGPRGEFELEPAVALDQLVWQGNSALPITFRVWFWDDADNEPGYTLELRKEARGWSVSRERLRLQNGWFDTVNQTLEYPTERRGIMSWPTPNRGTLCNLVYPYRNDQAALPVIAPFLEFAERFGQAWRYRPSALDIAAFARSQEYEARVRPGVVGENARSQEYEARVRPGVVGENGWGLSWALQQLQGADRTAFQAIESELHRIFPHIRFINFQTERFGVRLAFTTARSEDVVPASQESDGVLLTLFLLWRLYTATPPISLCLEEPENGTHPYLLRGRYELLKQFAYKEDGAPAPQLLVATHSADFLNTIEDPTEALKTIRVVEFDRDEGTVVHQLSGFPQIDTLLKVFNNNLGDLWWSGAIRAVPEPSEMGGPS